MAEPSQTNPRKSHKSAQFVNTNSHRLNKRAPSKPERNDSVIYVSSKSNTKALLDKCDKLVKKGENEIVIYCMGAAIQRGILLALQLCEKHPVFQVAANTSTVELVDDLEPVTDEADYEILRRNNSALRIRVLRPNATAQ